VKLKTLREKLCVTSYQHDSAEVVVEIDLAEMVYRGVKKDIRNLKVKRVKLSKKKLTVVATEE
jgi:hypothetical protein